MANFRKHRFKKALVIGLGLLAQPAMADDNGTKPVAAVKPADMFRPTAMPDRIVLTWTGDPRTTQAVTWRTSTEVKKGLAQLTVADAGPDLLSHASLHEGLTQVLITDLNEAHFHTVQWRGLKPATRYAYRVGDGTNWSEWFHFSTASMKPEPFSFVYFGDAQNDIRSLWSRVIREAYLDAPEAKFMIHAGDLINNAESDAEWGEWFGAGSWLNAMIPSVPVPGNHEMAKAANGERRLSHHWCPQFALPLNGPEGLAETCYTFEYHNLRLICMNSNEQLDTQTAWLEDVLSRNKSQWTICTFHHPVFSTGKDRDNPELRAAWKPLFDKYRVDLVLQGHDHTYGRTGLSVPPDPYSNTNPLAVNNVATGVQTVEPETGTVYVVSVSGPKMYNNTRYPFMKRVAEDTQLYQVIHIDGDSLRFEARTAVGELYDSFVLKKQPGKINKIEERIPDTPNRLRPAEPNPKKIAPEAVGASAK